MSQVETQTAPVSVSTHELFKTFGKIGVLSFGGPAGQIALMHRVIVGEKKWLSEEKYLNALSFCMLLPGPEAMQIATYAGWRLAGGLGGLVAGLLFVLPGAAVILALASVYALLGDIPLVTTIFLGIKAAVLVIVIEALIKVSKRALKRADYWVLAGLSFVAIFVFALPFPLIIAAAALYGFFTAQRTEENAPPLPVVPLARTLTTITLWLFIWLAPLGMLALFLPGSLLVEIGFFFSKLAVVTFGGAYAVLAYMAQDVVSGYGWLTAGEMMDSLGLAETTPGPLILVTQFVGFLAAFKEAGLGFAIAGALITLWVTFAPCFLWIFAGAPYVDWINNHVRLKGALSAITASVVGVILNLSLWFALHVLFGEVSQKNMGLLHVWLPDITTLDWLALMLAIMSAVILFVLKRGLFTALAAAIVGALVLAAMT